MDQLVLNSRCWRLLALLAEMNSVKWTDLGLTVTHHGNKNSAAKLDPAKTHTQPCTPESSLAWKLGPLELE